MATDLNKLMNDILNANNEAFMFSEVNDGGASNFDAPIVKIKLSKEEKEYMCDFLQPIGERGYRDCYYVDVTLLGQGNRRTTMARAAARYLKAAGYEASVRNMVD